MAPKVKARLADLSGGSSLALDPSAVLGQQTSSRTSELSRSGQTLNLPGGMQISTTGIKCAGDTAHVDPRDLEPIPGAMLGRGISGVVSAVLHRPSGTKLAIKCISMYDPQQRDEIRKEVEFLYHGSLASNYVVRFFGANFDGKDKINLVLECMDASLLDALQVCGIGGRPAGFPLNVLQAVSRQAVQALVYLHQDRRLLHRDVKPSNFLFNATGELKITDFGLSRQLNQLAEKSTVCGTTFCGTVTYMSPERLAGTPYSFAADVWGLGLTLFQVATGMHAFLAWDSAASKGGRATFWEVQQYILHNAVPALPDSFPLEFRDFVAACLRRDPSERPQVLALMTHPWISSISDATAQATLAAWVAEILPALKAAKAGEQLQRDSIMASLDDLPMK